MTVPANVRVSPFSSEASHRAPIVPLANVSDGVDPPSPKAVPEDACFFPSGGRLSVAGVPEGAVGAGNL